MSLQIQKIDNTLGLGESLHSGANKINQIIDRVNTTLGTLTHAELRLVSSSRYEHEEVCIVRGGLSINDGSSGMYYADKSDTTSPDDGHNVIVTNDGVRWKRLKENIDASQVQGGTLSDEVLPSIQSGKTFTGDVTVNANLHVNGTQFIANTETVEIKDNLGIINAGEVGAGITAGFAGWEADRGTLINYRWGFEESSDLWKLGEIGNLQAVATREDTPLANGIMQYNSTANRLDSKAMTSLVQGTTNQVNVSSLANGEIQLSLPQDIHIQANPEFNHLKVEGRLGINADPTVEYAKFTVVSNDDYSQMMLRNLRSTSTSGFTTVSDDNSSYGYVAFNNSNHSNVPYAGVIGVTASAPIIFQTQATERGRFTGAGTLELTEGLTVGKLATVKDDILPYQNYTSNIGSVNKKFLTAHVAELRVATLVASEERATVGGRLLVGHSTELISDLLAGETSIQVKHNNLNNGDIVYFETGGKVEFMKVTSSYIAVTGGYQYNVQRNLDGTGANGFVKGDGIFNTGQSGSAYIDLYAVNSLSNSASTAGATIAHMYRTGTAYNAIEARVVSGNLKGYYGYSSSTYGFGAGSGGAEHITVDSTNGVRLKNGSSVLAQLSGSTFSITSNVQVNADKSGYIAGGNISWNAQGDVTLDPSVQISYSSVTSKPTSLSQINATEANKLSGIEANATNGATWGIDLSGIPANLSSLGDIPSYIASTKITATTIESPVIAGNSGYFSGHIVCGENGWTRFGVGVNGGYDGLYVNSNNYWYSTGDMRIGGAGGINVIGTAVTLGSSVTIQYASISNPPAIYSGGFYEDFQFASISGEIPAGWKNYRGVGETSIVSDAGATGGYLLRIGNNSGDDTRWLIHDQNIEYNPSIWYKISVRARQTAGSGTAYFGFAGVGSDGITYVNAKGLNDTGNQHYIVARGVDIPSSWTEYVGYVRGYASGDGTTDASTDAKAHKNVRFIRPLILVNYNQVSGITEIDYFTIEPLNAKFIESGLTGSTKITSTTIEAPVIAGTNGYFSGYLRFGSDSATMRIGKDVSGSNDGIYINSNNYWYHTGVKKFGNSTQYVHWNNSNMTVKGDIIADSIVINSDFTLGRNMSFSSGGSITLPPASGSGTGTIDNAGVTYAVQQGTSWSAGTGSLASVRFGTSSEGFDAGAGLNVWSNSDLSLISDNDIRLVPGIGGRIDALGNNIANIGTTTYAVSTVSVSGGTNSISSVTNSVLAINASNSPRVYKITVPGNANPTDGQVLFVINNGSGSLYFKQNYTGSNIVVQGSDGEFQLYEKSCATLVAYGSYWYVNGDFGA